MTFEKIGFVDTIVFGKLNYNKALALMPNMRHFTLNAVDS